MGDKTGIEWTDARIAELRAAGRPRSQIVKETGWGKGTCQRALRKNFEG